MRQGRSMRERDEEEQRLREGEKDEDEIVRREKQ